MYAVLQKSQYLADCGTIKMFFVKFFFFLAVASKQQDIHVQCVPDKTKPRIIDVLS